MVLFQELHLKKDCVFLLRKQLSPQALQLPISWPTHKVHIQALFP